MHLELSIKTGRGPFMIEPAQRTAAKIVGITYLMAMAAAIFSGSYAHGSLVLAGDAVHSAHNILASERLFRISTVLLLITFASDSLLAAALYVVLKPINRNIALLGAFWPRHPGPTTESAARRDKTETKMRRYLAGLATLSSGLAVNRKLCSFVSNKWLGTQYSNQDRLVNSAVSKPRSEPAAFGSWALLPMVTRWFSFPLVAVRTYITLRGAVIKSILRIPHRKFEKLLGMQILRFHGAEIEQMAVRADDELNAIAIELFQKIFEHGNYGAFGHAAC